MLPLDRQAFSIRRSLGSEENPASFFSLLEASPFKVSLFDRPVSLLDRSFLFLCSLRSSLSLARPSSRDEKESLDSVRSIRAIRSSRPSSSRTERKLPCLLALFLPRRKPTPILLPLARSHREAHCSPLSLSAISSTRHFTECSSPSRERQLFLLLPHVRLFTEKPSVRFSLLVVRSSSRSTRDDRTFPVARSPALLPATRKPPELLLGHPSLPHPKTGCLLSIAGCLLSTTAAPLSRAVHRSLLVEFSKVET